MAIICAPMHVIALNICILYDFDKPGLDYMYTCGQILNVCVDSHTCSQLYVIYSWTDNASLDEFSCFDTKSFISTAIQSNPSNLTNPTS